MNRQDLDRHITGNYGEDFFANERKNDGKAIPVGGKLGYRMGNRTCTEPAYSRHLHGACHMTVIIYSLYIVGSLCFVCGSVLALLDALK